MKSAEAPAPRAVLVTGDDEFLLEEAAAEVAAAFAVSEEDHERIRADEVEERLPAALESGSLFAARRLVEADLTPLFLQGAESGKRRKRTKKTTDEGSEPAPRATPRSEAETTLRRFLDRGGTETFLIGKILLASGPSPATDTALYRAFQEHGRIQDVAAGDEARRAGLLGARARRLAAEKKISLEPAAVEKLLQFTEADPRLFASELDRIFDWAGPSGRIRARDIEDLVENRRSEETYEFFEALGRRDRAAVVGHLQRVLGGARLRMGGKDLRLDDPLRGFFNTLVKQLRNLLLVKLRCEEEHLAMKPDVRQNDYVFRIHPRLAAPATPEAPPPLPGSPWMWAHAYAGAARFSREELETAFLLCAQADFATRDGAPLEESLIRIVAGLVGVTTAARPPA